ncbi:MAG: DUF6152 family protein [Acidobacteriota bacterium]
MKAFCVLSWIALALIPAQMPLSAHHVWPVNQQRLVTVKGTVVVFEWGNPHPMITLAVPVANGNTEKWQIGGPALGRMEANGWTKTTVKTGDVITGIGYQLSNGEKVIKLERVILPTGKEILVYGR